MKRFRKKGIALFLTAVMVATMAPMAFADFSDIDGHQYENVVNDLGNLGVYKGYPDGTVQPDGVVTRCEYTVSVVRSVGKESLADSLNNSPTGFADDASIPNWCRGAVSVATAMGIITGYPDNTFRGTNSVNHAEALVMLVRALKMGSFVGDSWPTSALVAANDLGLDTDVNVFANLPAARGELAQMLVNALNTDLRYDEDGNVTSTTVTTLLASHFPDADPIGSRTVSGEFDRINASGDIVVDGTAYPFNTTDYVNADDLYLNTSKADITDLNNLVEDDDVELTLDSSGKVTKIEVTRVTFKDKALSAANVDTDETDYGDVTVDSTSLDVNDDTKITLNGEAVTMAELDAAFEAFQDQWDGENAIATVRTVGDLTAGGSDVTNINVITTNTVAGEITAAGADADGAYVRVDGVKYYTGLSLTVGTEYTLLLNSDNEAVVILTETSDDDEYFAKVIEYTTDGGALDTLLVEKADGTQLTLSDFAGTPLALVQANLNKVLHVDVAGGTATLLAGASAAQLGATHNFKSSTSTTVRLYNSSIAYAQMANVFYYDLANSEFIERSDLEETHRVSLYSVDGVTGFVTAQADAAAPTVVSAKFTGATTLVIVFNEAVNAVVGDFTDGTQSGVGAPTFTVDAIAGSGTATITLTVTGSEAIVTGDIGSVDIGAGVKDLAGNAITPVVNQAIDSGF